MSRIRSKDGSLIRDRRGQGGGGLNFPGLGRGGGVGIPGGLGKGGGGVVGLLLMLAIIFLPKLLGTGASNPLGPGRLEPGEGAANTEKCDTEIAQIICGAVESVDDYWKRELPVAFDGKQYESAFTEFYEGQTTTGCGAASAQMGPFYCPAPNDSSVYFDLDFLEQMQGQLGAGGDFAAQYIVAHEYGHHVQNLLGTSAEVQQRQQSAGSEAEANQWSRALELQADCYAGAWAGDVSTGTTEDGQPLLDDSDIDEAINAAEAVGDDRITGGQVSAENFNHGTSEQRSEWFRRGFADGPTACDTFADGVFANI